MSTEAVAELHPASTNGPITITLSPEMSDRVRSEIASHGYATPLSFVEEALNAFDTDHQELEPWMVQEIIEACEEYDRDPSTGRTPEQVRATLEAEYQLALKAE